MTYPGDSPRPYTRAESVVVLAAVVWTVLLLSTTGSTFASHLSNFGLVAVAAVAAVVTLRRWRDAGDADRLYWLLMGGGLVSWCAGQVLWTWYEFAGQEVGTPAYVMFLAMPLLGTAAFLSLPLSPRSLAGRFRAVLDGLMVATSLLLIVWVLGMRPLFRDTGDSMWEQSAPLAYVTLEIVIFTLVVFSVLRSRQTRESMPMPVALLGCGLLAFVLADAAFTYAKTLGTYQSGSALDAGWFLGFTLLLLGALRRTEPTVVREDVGEPVTPPSTSALPYVAVAAAVVVSTVDTWQSAESDLVVFWIRSAIIALLVARQVLALRENYSLTRDLELRVHRRTRELEASRQRFVALVRHSSDVVTVVTPEGRIQYQSGSCERVLGYRPEDLEGRPLAELMPPHEAEILHAALEHAASEPFRVHTVQTSWRHADAHLCRVEVTITNLLDDPDVCGLVLNTHDVTDRVLLEEELTRQAFTDSLTGLPNRALFRDRLQQALRRRVGDDLVMSVLFLDLDGFKAVNDTLGHSAGDDLLVQVSDRLRSVVRPGDTVARFGGDEFAVLLEDCRGEGVVEQLARRINQTIRDPFEVQGEQVHVAASVGIARACEHADTAEQLLRNADLAMYRAKALGLGGFAVFAPEMHAGLVERVRLETDLRRAVEQEQFVVHYQPMVSLRSGEITGVEALVRWQHPERGLLQPGDFIGTAEATGMVRDIGRWVLRTACRQASAWDDRVPGARPLKVSVNVSANQLHQADLTDQVREALAESGLAPERLTLEMTESVLIDHREQTLSTLRTLRSLGVRLAIDDFGTGYSSLSYLHRFPVDVLKIDRSFVERLSGGGDTALVNTILRMGQSLQLETVAEGIEHSQEALLLRGQGCTTGQGFHFSRPVDADELEAMLATAGSLTQEPGSRTTA